MDEFPPEIALDDTGWYQRHWQIAGYELRSHQGDSLIRMWVAQRGQRFTGNQYYWTKLAEYSRGYGDKTWVRIHLHRDLR